MTYFPYAFEGVVARYAFDRYAYTVVYLPAELATQLPFAGRPRLRIAGEIADLPVEGAWQPAGAGRWYFILSRRFLKDAGLSVGDPVEVRFAIADQDAVAIPDAVAAALKRDRAFAARWKDLTPGAQRAFAHRVASARTEPTRQRRLDEVRTMVLDGRRPGAPARGRSKR